MILTLSKIKKTDTIPTVVTYQIEKVGLFLSLSFCDAISCTQFSTVNQNTIELFIAQ